MPEQTVYTKKSTFVTLTAEELEAVLIKHYADIPLVAVPDVEWDISSAGAIRGVTISYEVQDTVQTSIDL